MKKIITSDTFLCIIASITDSFLCIIASIIFSLIILATLLWMTSPAAEYADIVQASNLIRKEDKEDKE